MVKHAASGMPISFCQPFLECINMSTDDVKTSFGSFSTEMIISLTGHE